MVNKKKITIILPLLIVTVLLITWFAGIIPSSIARISAESYVRSRYKDLNIQLTDVYWDNNWQRYFVSFKEKGGKVYNFRMSQYIPVTIMYDPINTPG